MQEKTAFGKNQASFPLLSEKTKRVSPRSEIFFVFLHEKQSKRAGPIGTDPD
jgi:hypothetical protein